jgi:ectoine hydroxylase-related dioxygenase (phytanoyl-CoA dioxygenase family)
VLAFTDSTELLDTPNALRARFDEDGYVFLRGAIDRDLLLDVRRRITSVCAAHGWFELGTDPLDAITCVEPCVEGDDRYFEVYDDVQRLEALHAVPHHSTVRRCMTALLGESAFPHPLSIVRLVFPENEEWATPPHQDYPNNQGTPDLYACWMPLGACPAELGSLSILSGSHRLGVAPLEFSLGAGNRRARLDGRFEELGWVGDDFDLGDAVIFHSHTVHRSLPNTTDRMRVSVDYRFQREGEPLTEGCLEPHFGRLTWDDIYRGWKRRDLQYFWRKKHFMVSPWDPAYHELSEEEQLAGMRNPANWRLEDRRLLAAELLKLGKIRLGRPRSSDAGGAGDAAPEDGAG